MSYNKAREEKKWKQWKEIEEKQMREMGVGEDVINKLWELDWADFPDYDLLLPIELEDPELNNVQRLIDAIEDEQLLHIKPGSDA